MIDTNCFVKAKLFSDSDSSITTTAKFFELKYNYDITMKRLDKAIEDYKEQEFEKSIFFSKFVLVFR